MLKLTLKSKLWFSAIVFCLAFTLTTTSTAFAWGGRYYWHGGGWYRSGWFWGGVAVSALTIGAIVATLPPHYSVLYVGGVPYYYDGVYYYQASPGGYVVVANPAVVAPAAVVAAPQAVAVAPAASLVIEPAPIASTETIIINVPNSRGGFTPVTLREHKDGYLGPQGEYYKGHPTVEQLKTLYGK